MGTVTISTSTKNKLIMMIIIIIIIIINRVFVAFRFVILNGARIPEVS